MLRRLLAIATIATIAAFVLGACSTTRPVAPAALDVIAPSGPLRWLLEAARWVLLVILVAVALAERARDSKA